MESDVEGRSTVWAEEQGFWQRKLVYPGRRGCVDRVFSRADRGPVFVEFKDKGEEPRINQKREHKRMRDAGIELHVVDSFADFKRMLLP